MNSRKLAAASFAALMFLTAAGCSSDDTSSSAIDEKVIQVDDGNGGVRPATVFGTTHIYSETGLEVTVSEPRPFTPEDPDVKQAAEYLEVDVNFTNGGKENFEFDPAAFGVVLMSAKDQGDMPVEMDELEATSLAPGKSLEFPVGFGVSSDEGLRMELIPNFGGPNLSIAFADESVEKK